MKLVGSTPYRQRVVLTLTVGGAAVGAFSLHTCCTPPPLPPIGPEPPPIAADAAPVPTVVVDAGPAPEAAADSPAEECRFVEPRARSVKREPRIVGGSAAPAGSHPSAVSLNWGGGHYCGGTVVAPRAVLTAAHCQVSVGDVARVGNVDRRHGRQIRIIQSRIHPDYDPVTFKNDVAIAVLAEEAGVPAQALADDVEPGTATAIGWGRLSEGGALTNHLQEVTVPIIALPLCKLVYGNVDDMQVCADTFGKGSCQGDSGGPLLQLQPGGEVQIGIVSYGIGCAREGAPGVYTSVAKYREWIGACSRI